MSTSECSPTGSMYPLPTSPVIEEQWMSQNALNIVVKEQQERKNKITHSLAGQLSLHQQNQCRLCRQRAL